MSEVKTEITIRQFVAFCYRLKPISFVILLVLLVLSGCKTASKKTSEELFDFRMLDTLMVTADKEAPRPNDNTPIPYRATPQRIFDLIHTDLDLRFDIPAKKISGLALLTLRPFFYAADTLKLDAKELRIQSVSLGKGGADLPYVQTPEHLVIVLPKKLQRDESVDVFIRYEASPENTGGSEAITSNQGLFFIDPANTLPEKPTQIWTQGETEWNSRWFPTIDHPNERFTHQISMTVDSRYKTLSNGIRTQSNTNPDGTRTDTWRMDQPHAPYLVMLAVGDFAVVEDQWRDVPLTYYVEPEYAAHAKSIYPNTPEILEFYSNRLGVKYPWPKLAQIVVRDYVSGAMENTTSIIYGEFMQQDSSELVGDIYNERVVAHEIFHHWFGDLVTTESWANLTLNEGFAQYGEYLWVHHKYGEEEAAFLLHGDKETYLKTAPSAFHPLVYFKYRKAEDMFDRHSYEKGALTLHMLRDVIGDEAFFKAITTYLQRFAYKSVESHDLRLVMEEITGMDLNWFFNQWFYQPGHPQLDVQWGHDAAAQKTTLTLIQTQDSSHAAPVYRLPIEVDLVFGSGEKASQKIWMNSRKQTFVFDAKETPLLLDIDPRDVLLMEKTGHQSNELYRQQYTLTPSLRNRIESLDYIVNGSQSEADHAFMIRALDDSFWYIRLNALEEIAGKAIQEPVLEKIRHLAVQDPHPFVRSSAWSILSQEKDKTSVELVKNNIQKERSAAAIAQALFLVQDIEPKTAETLAARYENVQSQTILEAVEYIYGESNNPAHLGFYQNLVPKVPAFNSLEVYDNFRKLTLQSGSSEETEKAITLLLGVASNYKEQTFFRKLAAMKTLSAFKSKLNQLSKEKTVYQALLDKLETEMIAIETTETDADLKQLYKNLK